MHHRGPCFDFEPYEIITNRPHVGGIRPNFQNSGPNQPNFQFLQPKKVKFPTSHNQMLPVTAMAATKKLSSLFPLLSLLCFISIFFLLSFSRRASISSPPKQSESSKLLATVAMVLTMLAQALDATTRTGRGSTTQMLDSRGTIAAARRYSKDGTVD
ncbi:hypothetical protein SLE2022_040700 [Rubroshorea leprosula]